MGDGRSLEKATHLCPGARTGYHPQPQTGSPGPSPSYQFWRPLTCPLPSPQLPAGLDSNQALSPPSRLAVAPRARPGPTCPSHKPPPHTQPSPHRRFPLPRPSQQSQQPLLPPFGPPSPESPSLPLLPTRSSSSLPYFPLLSPRFSPNPSPVANPAPLLPDPALPFSPRAGVAAPRPAPVGQVAHARARPRGTMTTSSSPGVSLSPQPPAHFSSPPPPRRLSPAT